MGAPPCAVRQRATLLWAFETVSLSGIPCTPESVLPRIPLLLSFTRGATGKQFPLPAPVQDIATFLLVRGPYAWIGYGWLGCISDYERPEALDYDYGLPVDLRKANGMVSDVFKNHHMQELVGNMKISSSKRIKKTIQKACQHT